MVEGHSFGGAIATCKATPNYLSWIKAYPKGEKVILTFHSWEEYKNQVDVS